MCVYSPQSVNRIAARYGRKRGLLQHSLSRLVLLTGGYQRFREVDWKTVKRIWFVCNGNICRSPYAAARAVSFGLAARSCGLDAAKDKPADRVAKEVAQRRGLSLAAHLSRPCDDQDFSGGDLLAAMEPDQGKHLVRLMSRTGVQVTLVGLWHRHPRPHIQDPYGLSINYFENCFAFLDESVKSMAVRINESL
jgi:protein-tyrosine phosphatase